MVTSQEQGQHYLGPLEAVGPCTLLLRTPPLPLAIPQGVSTSLCWSSVQAERV